MVAVHLLEDFLKIRLALDPADHAIGQDRRVIKIVVPRQMSEGLVARPDGSRIKVLQPLAEVVDKPGIGAAIVGRIERLVMPLEQPLRVGQRAFLLGYGRRGDEKHFGLDVRGRRAGWIALPEVRALRQQPVEDDKPFKIAQTRAVQDGVGAAATGVLPEQEILLAARRGAGDRGDCPGGLLPSLRRGTAFGVNYGTMLSGLWDANPAGNSGTRIGSRRSGDRVMTATTRLVEVRQQVLKKNDLDARALRAKFRAAGVYVVSLVSSPGAGKTMFLEKLLGLLRPDYRVAALVGDLATDNDARRLARSEVPVKQITTGTVCHLDAAMVRSALADWPGGMPTPPTTAGIKHATSGAAWAWQQLDFLFIENVGNLVCPATFDLGEDLRLVLFSVTEGEDKPLKYPSIFNTSDVAIITKMDLAAAVEFDAPAALRNIQSVRPAMQVFEVSAKTGHGMAAWTRFLKDRLKAGQGDNLPA
jgi:hydrogenase nickel incorporation protein HypB